MTAYGIDEAWARLTPGEMVAAGKTFVIGYVSEDRSKNLTRAEVDAYRAAGIAVLLVYEYSTTAVHGGAAKGKANATLAVSQARALGYPAGCAIAFAVDEDTTPNPSMVDAYARAFTAVCHAAGYRSMEYGGIATVKRCADLGLTDLHWQTYAWSGGRWDARATIRQTNNGVRLAGKDVDLDTAMVADFGAWMPTNNSGGSNVATDPTVEALMNRTVNGVRFADILGREDSANREVSGDVAEVLADTTAMRVDLAAIKAAVGSVGLSDAQLASIGQAAAEAVRDQLAQVAALAAQVAEVAGQVGKVVAALRAAGDAAA